MRCFLCPVHCRYWFAYFLGQKSESSCLFLCRELPVPTVASILHVLRVEEKLSVHSLADLVFSSAGTGL